MEAYKLFFGKDPWKLIFSFSDSEKLMCPFSDSEELLSVLKHPAGRLFLKNEHSWNLETCSFCRNCTFGHF